MLKTLCRSLGIPSFLILLFAGIDDLAHPKGTLFSSAKILPSHPSKEWELPPISPEDRHAIDLLLSQSFTYLNSGSQSYAFLSQNKKYVLKFLKKRKLRPNTWLAYLPLSWNPWHAKLSFFQDKEYRTLQAWKLAFLELKAEMGLLYVHLNPTCAFHKKILVTDKKGLKKWIELTYPELLPHFEACLNVSIRK